MYLASNRARARSIGMHADGLGQEGQVGAVAGHDVVPQSDIQRYAISRSLFVAW